MPACDLLPRYVFRHGKKMPIVASPLAYEAAMTCSLEAIHVSNSALPMIDIGGLSSNSVTDRRAVSERPVSITDFSTS